MSIQSAIKKQINSINESDKMYPNRHTTIHKNACKYCPSTKDIQDPEMLDIKATMTKEQVIKDTLFVCAWRTDKLCKGYCDYFGITEKDLI